MECIREITYAHSGKVTTLVLAGTHQVWSAGTDCTVKTWSTAGLHEQMGNLLESSMQGLAELEVRLRRQEVCNQRIWL